MNNWKDSLDRWLTEWYLGVDESYGEEIWDEIPESEISLEDFEKYQNVFFKWEDKLAQKRKTPKEAAEIIRRAYQRYKIT